MKAKASGFGVQRTKSRCFARALVAGAGVLVGLPGVPLPLERPDAALIRTQETVFLVKDINATGADSSPSALTAANGAVFFAVSDGTHGRELWKSDGTATGTVLVADLNPGPADSSPTLLTEAGGVLFFVASDAGGPRLWRTDGTAAGTLPVFEAPAGGTIVELADAAGALFFSVAVGVGRGELWKTDGTPGGTALVANIASPPRE